MDALRQCLLCLCLAPEAEFGHLPPRAVCAERYAQADQFLQDYHRWCDVASGWQVEQSRGLAEEVRGLGDRWFYLLQAQSREHFCPGDDECGPALPLTGWPLLHCRWGWAESYRAMAGDEAYYTQQFPACAPLRFLPVGR